MPDAKLAALIRKLSQKTNENSVQWEKTVEPEVFQASFPGYTIQITNDAGDIILRIYNDEGALMEEAKDTEFTRDHIPGGPFTVMNGMFTKARRKALGVDQALDTLLSELGD
jgi:hypothetical protein